MPPDHPGGRLARAGSAVLWYVVPAFVLLVVAAYIAGATFGHANPPVVPVEGVSMLPTLQTGDLVFLKGVDPKTLRKGDIIAVNVPSTSRQKYNLPGQIVHRIIKIDHGAGGLAFTTKGDSNPGPDVFITHANAVVGKLWFKAPGLGYPFLFFRSRQGEIFLGVAALIAVVYFGLGLIDERRVVVEGTAVTMETLLADTRELKETLTEARTFAAQPPAGEGTEEIADEVRAARAESEKTSATMHELVGAIGEYGEHLRSHTAVMKNLAATTKDLQRATQGLGTGSSAAPTPLPPPEHPDREWNAVLDLPVLSTLDLSETYERARSLDERLVEMSRRLDERTRRLEQLRRELEI